MPAWRGSAVISGWLALASLAWTQSCSLQGIDVSDLDRQVQPCDDESAGISEGVELQQ
jgi:hypothetical protein